MNELQVKTIKLNPAKIEFNHADIEKELQENLAQYDGLTFTNESTTELRSILAELRKGKKAVDDYRKKVKKELNEPVEKFEDTCKDLKNYFDNVIDPLDGQLKTFVEQERSERLEQLGSIRDEHILTHELGDEYTDRVVIESSLLTKSMSLKTAGESIEFQVKNLKMEQEKRLADIEIVKTNVKLANAESELSLPVDVFVGSLEHNDVDSVREQIKRAVNVELEKRENDKQAELDRTKREEVKAELEKQADEVIEQVEVPAPKADPIKSKSEFPFDDIEATHTDKYTINATKNQHKLIKEFLNENNIDWSIEMELPF